MFPSMANRFLILLQCANVGSRESKCAELIDYNLMWAFLYMNFCIRVSATSLCQIHGGVVAIRQMHFVIKLGMSCMLAIFNI